MILLQERLELQHIGDARMVTPGDDDDVVIEHMSRKEVRRRIFAHRDRKVEVARGELGGKTDGIKRAGDDTQSRRQPRDFFHQAREISDWP